MADAAIAILEGLREPPTVEEIPVGGPRPGPAVPETRVNTWIVLGSAAIAFFAGKKLAETAR